MRDKFFKMRCTDAERQAMDAEAQAHGYSNISEFMRYLFVLARERRLLRESGQLQRARLDDE